MKNFKNWLFTEEVFPNKTATVYHRTRSLDNVENILSKGYKVGRGCHYGCGLYTNIELSSQFNQHMSIYGNYIVKFKVTNLEKYLILPINIAKNILGKDYRISDQIKKLIPSSLPFHRTSLLQEALKTYDQEQSTEVFTGELFRKMYKEWFPKELFGVIYRGKQDGYCLLKYEPVEDNTITMLGYTEASWGDLDKMKYLMGNQGWITSTKHIKIKNIYKSPIEKRTGVELENPAKDLMLFAAKGSYRRFKNQLEGTKLSEDDVINIISNSKDKIKILNMLGERIKVVSILKTNHFYNILFNDGPNLEKRKEIIRTVLKYKSMWGYEVISILNSAFKISGEAYEIAKVLGKENIQKIGEDHFSTFGHLLEYNEDNMIEKLDYNEEPLIEKLDAVMRFKELGQNDVVDIIRSALDKYLVRKLDESFFELLKKQLGNNIKKLSPEDRKKILVKAKTIDGPGIEKITNYIKDLVSYET